MGGEEKTARVRNGRGTMCARWSSDGGTDPRYKEQSLKLSCTQHTYTCPMRQVRSLRRYDRSRRNSRAANYCNTSFISFSLSLCFFLCFLFPFHRSVISQRPGYAEPTKGAAKIPRTLALRVARDSFEHAIVLHSCGRPDAIFRRRVVENKRFSASAVSQKQLFSGRDNTKKS